MKQNKAGSPPQSFKQQRQLLDQRINPQRRTDKTSMPPIRPNQCQVSTVIDGISRLATVTRNKGNPQHLTQILDISQLSTESLKRWIKEIQISTQLLGCVPLRIYTDHPDLQAVTDILRQCRINSPHFSQGRRANIRAVGITKKNQLPAPHFSHTGQISIRGTE